MPSSHLLIIGDRGPLAWMLQEQRTAFPAYRAKDASALQVGDELLLYATRGCFHNPGKHRGRVIGRAIVTSRLAELDVPVQFGEREFPVGCDFELLELAPLHFGVEFPPLVPKLESFPNKTGWATRLRRALMTVTAADAALLRRELRKVAQEPSLGAGAYITAAKG